MIGSWFDDDNGEDSGSVYLYDYQLSTDTWTATEKIVADDGAGSDYFGVAVALTPDWMLVGAHRVDVPNPDSGAVYVYTEDLIFKDGYESLAGGVR